MALIKCPKCGNEFSDRAQVCPQCGFNLKWFMPVQLFLLFMGLLLLVFSFVGYFVKLYEINPVIPVILAWFWRIYLCTFWISRLFIAQSKERIIAALALACYFLSIACGVIDQVIPHDRTAEWLNYTFWGAEICNTVMCVIILLYSIFLSGIERCFAIVTGILMLSTKIVFFYSQFLWRESYYTYYDNYLKLWPIFILLTNISLIAFIISGNISSWKRKLFD